MDGLTRLQTLSRQMTFEPDGERSAGPNPSTPPGCFVPQKDVIVQPVQLPGGRPMKLLKSLLTSACERDCFYCPFRARRNFRRVTFKPEEYARTFIQIQQAGIADGTFLSSGIAGGGIRTQDRLIETAMR